MLSFRLLGPLRIDRDGRPLRLVGKPATLLVALLLRRNDVVPVERLVADLWEGSEPRSARKLLQAHISELRKALGHERVQTIGTGYLLAADEEELDLGRFERLRRDAGATEDAVEALEFLEEALALWRGAPLADLREEPLARVAAARLEELRLHVLEERLDARLAIGERRALVPELEVLVADNPLRERLRGQLMLALYGSGRQAAALTRYREGRRLLVETLGLEPGPELRRVEEAILRHDPGLEALRPAAPRTSILVAGDDDRALALVGAVARRRGAGILIVRRVTEVGELEGATEALATIRSQLAQEGIAARVAALRSGGVEALVRLAASAAVDLAMVGVSSQRVRDLGSLAPMLEAVPCDLALLVRSPVEPGAGPVVVAFGGGDHEWAALELGVALAEAHGRPLCLAGGRREGDDASRALAAASLAVQRVSTLVPRPVIVAGGADEVGAAAEGATALLLGLPDDWRTRGLGDARAALAAASPAPTLLVRRGLRVGSIAPETAITRFTWSS